MGGILDAIGSRLWPTLRAPEPKAVPSQPEINELYTLDEKGRRCFQMDKLSIAQCDVITEDCRKEATYERYLTISGAVGATALAIGTIIAGVVVAKLASLFFVVTLSNIATHFLTSYSPLTYFFVRVVTHIAALSGTVTLLQMLWNYTYESVQNHWEAAKHYEDQALQTQLRKAVEKINTKAELATS